MKTLTITTDQTDADGDYIEHEFEVHPREGSNVLIQCNSGIDYLMFSAVDGEHTIRRMDVHKVTVR